MESSGGSKPVISHIIREHLEDFERRLTRELTEKFTERKYSGLARRRTYADLI